MAFGLYALRVFHFVRIEFCRFHALPILYNEQAIERASESERTQECDFKTKLQKAFVFAFVFVFGFSHRHLGNRNKNTSANALLNPRL
jgi:hypothetical protein